MNILPQFPSPFIRRRPPPRSQIPEWGMWQRNRFPLSGESQMTMGDSIQPGYIKTFEPQPIDVMPIVCPAGIFRIGGGCGHLPINPIEVPITPVTPPFVPSPAPVADPSEPPVTDTSRDPASAQPASSSQTALNAAIGIGGVVSLVAFIRWLTR